MDIVDMYHCIIKIGIINLLFGTLLLYNNAALLPVK